MQIRRISYYAFILLIVILEIVVMLGLTWLVFLGHSEVFVGALSFLGGLSGGLLALVGVYVGMELTKRKEAKELYPGKMENATKVMEWASGANYDARSVSGHLVRETLTKGKQIEGFVAMFRDLDNKSEEIIRFAPKVNGEFYTFTSEAKYTVMVLKNLLGQIDSAEEMNRVYAKSLLPEQC